MSQESSIKIRTLPRANEGAKQQKPKPQPAPRWIIYVGTTALALLVGAQVYPRLQKQAVVRTPTSASQQPGQANAAHPARSYDSVNRHLQESAAKTEMLARVREMENRSAQDANLDMPDEDYTAANDSEHLGQGVTFDSENTAERLYADLNEDAVTGYADTLPGDKINARLANRRWVNELERAERVQFVRNYIRAAAEKGYEVQIDQNLVVVGVRKIQKTNKLSIDQVLQNVAQKGR
jgi:hypothetical protein